MSSERKGFCRNPRGIFPTKFPGEFCGGFFGGFFRAFFLGKKEGKNPYPKSTAKFKSEFGSFAAKIHTARSGLEFFGFEESDFRKCWQSPVSFEVFQTKVAHFCFCLVRIRMLFPNEKPKRGRKRFG